LRLSSREMVEAARPSARAIALPDRLTHRCHILETGNDSLRFRTSFEAARRKKEVGPALNLNRRP
jgi:hypothetical protein